MINVAVVGLGKIGLLLDQSSQQTAYLSHTGGYAKHDQFHIVAGVDTYWNDAKKVLFASFAPTAKQCTTIAELYDQDITCVSLCTPAAMHEAQIEQLLHIRTLTFIFCEKPVAVTSESATRIAALCAAKKVTIVPHITRRFWSDMQQLHTYITQGHLGQLKHMDVRYTRGLYNTGSHMFDFIRWLCSDIETVQVGQTVHTSAERDGDKSVQLFMQTKRGTTVQAQPFNDDDYYMYEWDIYGTLGKIELRMSGNTVHYYRVQAHPLFGQAYQALQLFKTVDDVLQQSCMSLTMQHIADFILKATPLPCTFLDGIQTLAITEKILASVHSKHMELM